MMTNDMMIKHAAGKVIIFSLNKLRLHNTTDNKNYHK